MSKNRSRVPRRWLTFESLEDRRLLAVIEVPVAASSDDAEERLESGAMQLISTDLDMTLDSGGSTPLEQLVGLRFTPIEIPQSATIDHAYIQFVVDETTSVATSLTVEGEDVDDALEFTTVNGNISSRSRTGASVAWSPPPWTLNDAGPDQQTPDIASVVQEIVDRPGWWSGNALVLIISGTGQRVAESSDSSVPSKRPVLHVEYTLPGVTIGESSGSTDVSEDGEMDSYTVMLDSVPSANVDVTVTPDGETNLGAGAGTSVTLTFTPENALTPQTVNVAAVDDQDVEGPHTSTISHVVTSTDTNYNGVSTRNVIANILDNDKAEISTLYLSLVSAFTLPGGHTVANEDILAWDGMDFSVFFDGSDVGIGPANVNAFDVIGPEEILMSFASPETVPGITETVEEWDIVKFTATQLGDTTAGTFEMFFRGGDLGLSTTSEGIEAVQLLDDGRLAISTTGSFSVPGLMGENEDLAAFMPDTPGDYSSGTWEVYFDGSDVALSGENVDSFAVDPAGDLYISTTAAFSVAGVSGDDEDVFVFTPTQLGEDTAGTYSSTLLFDGSLFGLAENDVNAIDVVATNDTPDNDDSGGAGGEHTFFVVDDQDDMTYFYASLDSEPEAFSLDASSQYATGVAANADGSIVWVVDKNRNVYVHQSDGQLLGIWKADGIGKPSGIATDGIDVWIVDKKNDDMYYFANGASLTSGIISPTSSFELHDNNPRPTGLTTDGQFLWAVDSEKDEVFKYTTAGLLVGQWSLGAGDIRPEGVTIDPTGSSNGLWVVDRLTRQVLEYTNGATYVSGTQSADVVYVLDSVNKSPKGIADPPVRPAPPSSPLPSQRRADPVVADGRLLVPAVTLEMANASSPAHRVNPVARTHDEALAVEVTRHHRESAFALPQTSEDAGRTHSIRLVDRAVVELVDHSSGVTESLVERIAEDVLGKGLQE